MAAPAIRVEGLDELLRAVRALGDQYDVVVRLAHAEFAKEVTARAAPNVRVRSGRMKKSLRSSGTKNSAVGRVGSGSVPYAAVQHWKYGPPFLTDAAAAIDATAEERQQEMVNAVIDRLMGR